MFFRVKRACAPKFIRAFVVCFYLACRYCRIGEIIIIRFYVNIF
nr:MAG TPA: hypothetical protein [Caudoviricetes sp.]